MAGDEAVIRKVLGDLTSAGKDSDEGTIRDQLSALTIEAKRQLMEAL